MNGKIKILIGLALLFGVQCTQGRMLKIRNTKPFDFSVSIETAEGEKYYLGALPPEQDPRIESVLETKIPDDSFFLVLKPHTDNSHEIRYRIGAGTNRELKTDRIIKEAVKK